MLDPNSILVNMGGQVWLKGVKEIIGADDLEKALSASGMKSKSTSSSWSINTICTLEPVLVKTYGQQGSKGVMLRSGRACFKYFIKQQGHPLGLDLLSFRMQPQQKRVALGLQKLAEFFTRNAKVKVQLHQDQNRWYWEMTETKNADLKKSSLSHCDFMIGFLQNFLGWCGNGKNYQVAKVSLKSGGTQKCAIGIDKKPWE